MSNGLLKKLGIGVGIVILQLVFFRHLKVWSIQPDVVLLYVLWLMNSQNRTATIIVTACLALFQDALLDTWGLNMFAKILLAFIAYNTITRNVDLRSQLPRLLTVIFSASLFHNLLFVLLSSLTITYSAEFLFFQHWIGSSIYTTLVGGIVLLFSTR